MKPPLIQKVKIWIDMDNSPHVPFFIPIIRELERKGHAVVLTTRDESQVCRLADYHKLSYRKIGRHYGANRLLKLLGTVWRSLQLAPMILREKPDLSLSHGSRALIVLSSALGIPTIQMFDYEHAQQLPLIVPALGVAPRAIDTPSLSKRFKYGLRTYDGLKEDVYVSSFKPDPSILGVLGLDKDDIVATIRPPATQAHYHNPEAERLFVQVVEVLGRTPGVRMVIVPRYDKVQKDLVSETWPEWCKDGRIIVPRNALDGLNLIWHSDLVISGGGTMNREAAALGVPVYSIFRGPLGAVDKYLAEQGRLTLLTSVEDVTKMLQPIKRTRPATPELGGRAALNQILAAIDELIAQAQVRLMPLTRSSRQRDYQTDHAANPRS
jgi:predicted glycosyltransferase